MRQTEGYCSKIIILDKMGSLWSKLRIDEPKIKIFDCTPPGDDFDYLRPKGTKLWASIENVTFLLST